MPTQTPTPTVTALESTVERVIDAEAILKSGQIDASIVYTDDSRSTTSIRFDLGNDDHPPRAAIRTTYHSSGQTRTTEQIIIGSDVWERVDDGEWRAAGNVEAVWGQVQAYLPRMTTVSASQLARDSRPDELRWYDPARDTDVTLRVDSDRGEPRAMLRVTRGTGTALDVVYTGWNSSVQITPPVD